MNQSINRKYNYIFILCIEDGTLATYNNYKASRIIMTCILCNKWKVVYRAYKCTQTHTHTHTKQRQMRAGVTSGKARTSK